MNKIIVIKMSEINNKYVEDIVGNINAMFENVDFCKELDIKHMCEYPLKEIEKAINEEIEHLKDSLKTPSPLIDEVEYSDSLYELEKSKRFLYE